MYIELHSRANISNFLVLFRRRMAMSVSSTAATLLSRTRANATFLAASLGVNQVRVVLMLLECIFLLFSFVCSSFCCTTLSLNRLPLFLFFTDCNGNFDDHQPVCALGITWDGKAEANCGGTGFGKTCTTTGPCNYRADGQPSVLPTTGGKGLDWKAAAANTNTPSHDNAPYDYSEALAKLLLYYDSMISGNLTKPGVCRRRLTWRSDSCASCVGKYGEDLSGGFYEAGGSTLKYPSIISGFSGTMLAWAGLEYGDAITRAGSMDDLKWKVKWAADHVIAAHPEPEVFAGFLGNQTW
jgi:hypothetical protein